MSKIGKGWTIKQLNTHNWKNISMKIYKDLAEFKLGVGEQFVSDWITITQDMINKFAEGTLT